MQKAELIKSVDKLLRNQYGVPKRNPNPPDPLDMLIGTVLSQNTNDKNSYQAYKKLKDRYPTWEEAFKARRSSIEKEIKIAGLGLQKSKAIKEILKGLKERYGTLSLGRLIEENNDSQIIEELTCFNGVGVKTASCVLLFALYKNICPVDTHVHRTVNRLGIVVATTPDKTFWALNEKFPPRIAHSFHTNLIRLGREICKPKNPACSECPLEKICQFDQKNMTGKKSNSQNAFMLLDNI
jgi:endonuclease-3